MESDSRHASKQVMLITGTRKGLGRYLAEFFVSQGYCVIGCSRDETSYKHSDYQHFCLDIADESSVRQLFSEIRKRHGKLDVLINNAGIAAMNHAVLTPADTIEKVLRTNVLGSFLMCREAVKLMKKERSGRIINFSTVAAKLDLEGESIYAASKSAVESLTRILAREFADFGVTVNAVGPTPIATDLIRNVPKVKINSLISRQAIRRMGEPDDVLNVIRFYLKPESNFITGQVIYLGGV